MMENRRDGESRRTEVGTESVESGHSDHTEALAQAKKLIVAAMCGPLGEVARLVDSGCSVDMRNEEGQTALMYAVANGKIEIVDYLIASGCDVEASCKSGNRAIMDAAFCGEAVCLGRLLAAGCKLDVADLEGTTPLMHAVYAVADGSGQSLDCLALLLEAGCDVEAKDRYEETAGKKAMDRGLVSAWGMLEAERERRMLSAETRKSAPGPNKVGLRI